VIRTIAAPDGLTLAYEAWDPAATPRAAVILLHDWGEYGGRYAWLGERLRDLGLAAYAPDLRGHGASGGRRGHLARFSQLLGDLHALRRAVQARTPVPQVLLGQAFGALVALRYAETQPIAGPAAVVAASPTLGPAHTTSRWRRYAGTVFAHVWPGAPIGTAHDVEHRSRDPDDVARYAADPKVHHRLTAGAWHELRWAQQAVVADASRIDVPAQFLLAGEDQIADAELARAFAASLRGVVDVKWYGEMYHDVIHDPQHDVVLADITAFLRARGLV
jgi:alpha-beta hydrolase superfamily lysophospholipase